MMAQQRTWLLWNAAGCPAGRYFAPGANDADATCKDCELGAYCTSKPYLVPDTQTATMGSAICGANLTTKKKRSTLERHCGKELCQAGL